MLTNKQKAVVKQAQRDCGLSDAEYRDAWRTIAGPEIDSSTDERLTDENFDAMMSYLEAIFERLNQPPTRTFAKLGYWRGKNSRAENSRDRFTRRHALGEIDWYENQLREVGCEESYFRSIRRKVFGLSEIGSETPAPSLFRYKDALQRTLSAKTNHAHAA